MNEARVLEIIAMLNTMIFKNHSNFITFIKSHILDLKLVIQTKIILHSLMFQY